MENINDDNSKKEMQIPGHKAVKVGRVTYFKKKEYDEMTEEELEQVRSHDDYVYHFMKEEQISGRRID